MNMGGMGKDAMRAKRRDGDGERFYCSTVAAAERCRCRCNAYWHCMVQGHGQGKARSLQREEKGKQSERAYPHKTGCFSRGGSGACSINALYTTNRCVLQRNSLAHCIIQTKCMYYIPLVLHP